MNNEKHIATIELFGDRRLVVSRRVVNDQHGLTTIRVESKGRDGSWFVSVHPVGIPNSAIFLLEDAIGKAAKMAEGDRR